MTAVENEKSTVTVTLNGVEIEANPGELLIDAAERHGTYIPRFCYHSRMKPVGMCRMCLSRSTRAVVRPCSRAA